MSNHTAYPDPSLSPPTTAAPPPPSDHANIDTDLSDSNPLPSPTVDVRNELDALHVRNDWNTENGKREKDEKVEREMETSETIKVEVTSEGKEASTSTTTKVKRRIVPQLSSPQQPVETVTEGRAARRKVPTLTPDINTFKSKRTERFSLFKRSLFI